MATTGAGDGSESSESGPAGLVHSGSTRLDIETSMSRDPNAVLVQGVPPGHADTQEPDGDFILDVEPDHPAVSDTHQEFNAELIAGSPYFTETLVFLLMFGVFFCLFPFILFLLGLFGDFYMFCGRCCMSIVTNIMIGSLSFALIFAFPHVIQVAWARIIVQSFLFGSWV